MPISFNKLIQMFNDKGITSYTITKKDRIIGQSTWDNIHSGRGIDTNTLGALCEYLNCQPGDILEYVQQSQQTSAQSDKPVSAKYIYLDFPEMPASAGKGVLLEEECNTKFKVVSNDITKKADFVIRVSGDSMEPEYYHDDIVLVKKQPEINIGEIGIFVLNGEGYIKKYGGDRLVSLNKKYKDILLSDNDNCVCAGKVIGKI